MRVTFRGVHEEGICIGSDPRSLAGCSMLNAQVFLLDVLLRAGQKAFGQEERLDCISTRASSLHRLDRSLAIKLDRVFREIRLPPKASTCFPTLEHDICCYPMLSLHSLCEHILLRDLSTCVAAATPVFRQLIDRMKAQNSPSW